MATLNIPEPVGMTFEAWANAVADQTAQWGISGPTTDWVDWACTLYNVPDLNIPSPIGFDAWDTWAKQFYGSVR